MSYLSDLAVCVRMLSKRIADGVPSHTAYNIYQDCINNAHLPSQYES